LAEPSLLIVAGPNGAGKTTYAFRHLEAVTGNVTFVNLDEIARGYSPLRPSLGQQYAARAALERTRSLIREGASFSIETTLSGKTHLRTIAAAKAAGYSVSLFYFAAPDVETCLARIARRVAEGGHDVPAADVRRRFLRSLANLPAYAGACDLWRVFDAARPAPKVVAEGRGGCVASVGDVGRMAAAIGAWVRGLPACGDAGN
jgi:predicted ABC-type ATPase